MKLKYSAYLASRFFLNKSGDKNFFRHIRGAVLGIALSLIPLVIVLQVTDGMIEGITKRYIEIGSYHFQAKNIRGIYDNTAADNLKKHDFIDNAFDFIQETCLIYTKTGRTGVSVRGLPENLYLEDRGIRENLEFYSGSFNLEENSILLSRSVADKIGAELNDEIRLLTAYVQPGRPMVLRPARFTVKGIFTTGYRELDEISVYIGFTRAKQLFRDAGSIITAIKVNDPYASTEKTASAIRDVLPESYYVTSWYRLNYTLYKSLETTKKLLIFIMFLILGVASLNISSAMVMMVISRKKEIAILKSIGFSHRDIANSFLFTGFMIGLAGTAAGISAGILCSIHVNLIIGIIEAVINFYREAAYILLNHDSGFSSFSILKSGYYLEKIPVTLKLPDLFIVTFASLLLSSAASFLPSLKAGKIKPVEILQKN